LTTSAPTWRAVRRGERAAFVELGVVLVHLGQGQDISGCGLEIGSVPNRVERQWLRDVQAGVGPEVGIDPRAYSRRAPEFCRGHGALYDTLAAGRIEEENLAALLAGTFPAGRRDESEAWGADQDRIDYGVLEQTWPTGPPRRSSQSGRRAHGRGGCGSRSARRPIPGRTPNAVRAAATSIMAPAAATAPARPFPAGEYQFTAAAGHLPTV